MTPVVRKISLEAFDKEAYQSSLEALVAQLGPLEIAYPIILQFLGYPWDQATYTFDKPLFMGKLRQDILDLTWTRCLLGIAAKKGYSRDYVYNGELVRMLPKCEGVEVTLFVGTPVQTIDEAFKALYTTGLHVHRLDDGSLLGGSHVDASSGQNVVENGFYVCQHEGTWKLELRHQEILGLTLHEAVTRIIERIAPQPNIAAPPRKPSTGPVCY